MNLYLKEKVFSIKGKFNVYDENQKPLYTVEGKWLSLHHKHYIYNPEGQQVAYISQKLIGISPKFFIELSDGKTYELKSKLAFAHEVCVIEELGWEIKGDFRAHDYTITRGDQELATVHQKWISWGDTYEITVADDADAVLVLAVMVCVDMMHEEEAQIGEVAAAAATTSVNIDKNE